MLSNAPLWQGLDVLSGASGGEAGGERARADVMRGNASELTRFDERHRVKIDLQEKLEQDTLLAPIILDMPVGVGERSRGTIAVEIPKLDVARMEL